MIQSEYPPPSRGMLRTGEAADLLGTTPAHIAALIRSGSLDAADVSVAGARRPSWRIPQGSLDRFVQERRSVR
jgi:hypothetical protein